MKKQRGTDKHSHLRKESPAGNSFLYPRLSPSSGAAHTPPAFRTGADHSLPLHPSALRKADLPEPQKARRGVLRRVHRSCEGGAPSGCAGWRACRGSVQRTPHEIAAPGILSRLVSTSGATCPAHKARPVFNEVTKGGVVGIPYGGLQGNGLLGHFQHGTHAFHRAGGFLRDFLRAVRGRLLHQLLLRTRISLLMVSIMCTGMRMVRAWSGNGAGDGLADPPGGIRGEFVTAANCSTAFIAEPLAEL